MCGHIVCVCVCVKGRERENIPHTAMEKNTSCKSEIESCVVLFVSLNVFVVKHVHHDTCLTMDLMACILCLCPEMSCCILGNKHIVTAVQRIAVVYEINKRFVTAVHWIAAVFEVNACSLPSPVMVCCL